MSLHYIIDGYNIIRHNIFPHRKDLQEDRRFLINLIRDRKLCGSPKNKVTIVFDGVSNVTGRNYNYPYEIIFSKNESADSKIKKLVSVAKNPKEIVVVSDDKEIAFFISASGAKPLGVKEFMGRAQKREAEVQIEPAERKLSYTEAAKINEELKKIWLR
ncbi:MAG: NYN domain-containing protein [Candidatus Omnitrophica bacterium]|nr:NYN domain-containing protein [Candidatus Omnitrophota bacterium]